MKQFFTAKNTKEAKGAPAGGHRSRVISQWGGADGTSLVASSEWLESQILNGCTATLTTDNASSKNNQS